MDRKKHLKYTADDLLNDESFLLAEKDSSDDKKKYWDKLAMEDTSFAAELIIARKILSDIHLKAVINQMSSTEEEKLWDRIETSKNEYNNKKRRLSLKWKSISVAASILFLALLYPLFFPVEKNIDYSSIINTQNIPDTTTTDITLILSENEKIHMDGKEAEVDYQNGYVHIKTEIQNIKKKEQTKEKLNQLVVPKGKRSFIKLSDGTKVWVNAGSVVVYPVEFTDKIREIYVEGEIFLDVIPDKNKSFKVKTRNINVNVLGTRFNVSAYNEEALKVSLVEGKVEIKLPDKTSRSLDPKQQFSYENEIWDVQEIISMDHLAWINGYYQYKDQRLDDIIKGLIKYYGNTITYNDEVTKYICSGKLDLKNDLKDVLTTLENAIPIKVEYFENEIFIDVKP